MKRTLTRVAVAVIAAACFSALAGVVYGRTAFVECLEILAPLGAATTLLAHAVAGNRARLHGLRRQLGVLALLTAAQLAAAIALFAAVMFVSRMDAFFMALAGGYAALVGLGAARLVARRALTDLDAVRAALAEVGEGSREISIAVRGKDELTALAADVEAMVAKVHAEERTRRELVAAVSHDLRTPVTTIRLIAEGLEDGIFEPDLVRGQLQLISTHVRGLSSLIDDLLELSRLDAGEVHWSVHQVRLDQLVQDTIDAMRPHADAGQVVVRAELDHDLAPARGNPEQLQRVLFNLIQNAIRHTPADGSVVIRAEHTTRRAVEIEVADTGDGIDPALRDRIFEPFTQGPSRIAGETGSAGLGLAIARAIINAHGGRIWLAGDGPGTRIRFSIPAV
jgi:signal transduction histidine kinase